MYEEYWELKEKPFLNTPDPRFLYYSAQHEEALSRLLYTVQERVGAAILTGVFGCGKTVIARALLGELSNEKYKMSYMSNPRLNDIELLRMIVYNLGVKEPPVSKTDVLNILKGILLDNMRNGKGTVVVIDEAQSIDDDEIFEEIRLLLNFQLEDTFLLTLLLIGQPDLSQRINNNVQLEQRINIKCHLAGLAAKDVEAYINHRLKVADRAEPIFTKKAITSIVNYSGGIPRRINRLCDLCLLSGFAAKVDKIDDDIVKDEIKALE